ANGAIRWLGSGPLRCARICAVRSAPACARSKPGPSSTAWRSPNGRPARSIRFSTSTRRTTRPRPSAWREAGVDPVRATPTNVIIEQQPTILGRNGYARVSRSLRGGNCPGNRRRVSARRGPETGRSRILDRGRAHQSELELAPDVSVDGEQRAGQSRVV